MRFFLIALAMSFSIDAFACKVDSPFAITLFTNLEKKESSYFRNNKIFETPPVLNIHSCQETSAAKKYVMIAVGAEQFGLEDAKRSISYTGEYTDDKCEIKDSPITSMPFNEKYKFFKKKSDYLKKCIETIVTHSGSRPISYAQEQRGCIIEKINNNKVKFQGGFCYFRPSVDSSYDVTIKVKETCHDMPGLKDVLQGPQELNGALNIYIAGDDSGSSPDLKAIKSTPITISIDPLKELLPISDDFGTGGPRWPSQWVFPDIHLGKLQILPFSNEHYKISVPILVDHQCQTKCIDGICSGPCEYALPVAGEFILSEVTTGKDSYITSWMDGGIAPANWQGLINGFGDKVLRSDFAKGRKYKIEFNLMDPKIDFDIFKNRTKKKLPELYPHIGNIVPGETISDVQDIPSFGVNKPIPTIPEVGAMFGLPMRSLDGALAALNSHLVFGNWPPTYDLICDAKIQNCVKRLNSVVKYQLFFEVMEDADEYSPLTLGNFKVQRVTPFATDYQKEVSDLPRVVCP